MGPVVHAYKIVISQRAAVRGVDGKYDTHTTCMSVPRVKAGNGKYNGHKSRHTREGVYLLAQGPNQSTIM